jgi:hypothetical protein
MIGGIIEMFADVLLLTRQATHKARARFGKIFKNIWADSRKCTVENHLQ